MWSLFAQQAHGENLVQNWCEDREQKIKVRKGPKHGGSSKEKEHSNAVLVGASCFP